MFSFEQMALLHRHEQEWRELEEVHDAPPGDDDVERRLLRGEKLFRCSGCDTKIMVVPPAAR